MDVSSCVHDFTTMNELCAAPVPEKMNIAGTGLSAVRIARAHAEAHTGEGKAPKEAPCVHNVSFRWCHCVFLR